MIQFTGTVYFNEDYSVDNHFGGEYLFCLINGRLYEFDNKEEGKAFYEFWQKH